MRRRFCIRIHVHNILRSEITDDGVLAAVGGEDDAVRGFERRNVHRVVASVAVDGDRVEVEAGLVEVADHRDGIARHGAAIGAARRRHTQGADDDFFNVVEFRHHGTVAGDHDFGVGVERQASDGVERCCTGVDDERFSRRGVGGDGEGVFVRTAVNKVTAARGTCLGDRVRTAIGVDEVVAAPGVDGVVPGQGEDGFAACSPVDRVGKGRTRHHTVVHAVETQGFNCRNSVDAFGSRVVGHRDDRAVRAQREVAARPGIDSRVGTRAAIDGVVTGTARDHIVAVATVQQIVARKTIHRVRTTEQVACICPVGDVVTRGAGERAEQQGNAGEAITHHAGHRRSQSFNRTDTIGEAGRDTQDGTDLSITRSEAGSRCSIDVGPGHAIVSRGLPLIGQGSDTIDVGNAADIEGKGLRFSRRQIADHRGTGCGDRTFDDGCGRSRSQGFQRTCGDVGEGRDNLQQRTDLCPRRGIARARCAGDIGPGCAIVGRNLPLVGQRTDTVGIGNRGGVDRQRLTREGRGVADDRRAGGRLGEVGNGSGRGRDQDFRRLGKVGPGHLNANQRTHLGLRSGEAVSGGTGDVGPSGAIVSRGLPLDHRVDHAVGVDDGGQIDRQHLTFHWRGVADRRGTGCSHRDHSVDVINDHTTIAVREAELFDVGQTVRTVGLVAYQYGIVRHCGRAISVADKAVVGHDVAEHRHVLIAGLIAVEDFADDVELTGVQLTAEHQLVEGLTTEHQLTIQVDDLAGHMLGRRHRVAVCIIDADADVEPTVAVDDVVTVLTLDDVATATTKDDVMRRAGQTGGDLIGVPDDIGSIEYHDFMLAIGGGDRFATQMGNQSCKTIDPGNAFTGQSVGVRQELVCLVRNPGAATGRATSQRVVQIPTREALDAVVTVAQNIGLLVDEERKAHIGICRDRVVLVDHPVKPGHAIVALHADALDHDVVAGFSVIIAIIAATVHHVMADDRAVEEQFRVLTCQRVETVGTFEPVIAFVAHDHAGVITRHGKVIALTRRDGLHIATTQDEVLAGSAEQQVETFARADDVVAGISVDHVSSTSRGAAVGDDVVTRTAEDVVDALTAFEPVVAAVTPKGVVAFAADQCVADFGTAEYDMVHAGIAQVIIGTVTIQILTDDHRADRLKDHVIVNRIGHTLKALVQLKDVGRGQEHRAGQVRGISCAQICVADRQFGPRVGFELVEQVHALRAAEVVEAVTSLQIFHLRFENEGEGRTKQAAKGHLLFGKTANPEIDQVEAGFLASPITRAVQEVEPIDRCIPSAHDKGDSGVTLRFDGHGVEDRLMLTISGDEVDHRCRGLDRQGEVEPAAIGFKLRIAGLRKEVRTDRIERRHASFSATGDVERREIERQADKVVAQSASNKLINLVADLTGHATDDCAGRCICAVTSCFIGNRIEERLDKAEVRRRLPICSQHIDSFIQLRMAEAVDCMRKLSRDCRIDIHRVREDERVDVGADRADEFFEHQMLIDLLGGEACCLEQALAVPFQRRRVLRHFSDFHRKPFIEERDVAICDQLVLDLFDAAVVLRVEHVVDGGQSYILVRAAVTSDEMLVEQFVVVGRTVAALVERDGIADVRVSISRLPCLGIGIVCDVGEERVTRRERQAGLDRSSRIAFDQRVRAGHQLGKAVGAGDEVAVEVGGKQRDVVNVHVAEFDAEHFAGLQLDVSPGGGTTIDASKEPAGRDGLAIDQLVFAQEHLMRGVRRIILAEVNPWTGGIGGFAHIIRSAKDAVCAGQVGGAGQDHEVGRAARNIKRIFRLQRNIDSAAAALCNAGQTVVKELAENGHETIERGRAAKVGHHVGDDQIAILHFHTSQGKLVGRFSNCCISRSIGFVASERGCFARIKLRTTGWQTGGQQRLVGFKQRLVSGDRGVDADACCVSCAHHAGVQGTGCDADTGQGSDNGYGVGERLIGNKVGDDTRLAVIDRVRQLFVAGGRASAGIGFSRAPRRRRLTRHEQISRASGCVDEIVELAIHGAQTIRRQGIQGVALKVDKLTSCSVVLSDFDLLQNVNEIIDVQFEHCLYSPCYH